MPTLKRYDDQITTPMPLALGVALRVISAATGESISLLVRKAVMQFFRDDETFQRLLKHFETLTPDQLMREKAKLTTEIGYISSGESIIQEYLAERER